MRKRAFAFLTFFFGVGIVAISVWRARIPLYAYETSTSIEVSDSEVSTVSGEEVIEKDYSLPFPGILPDHPLYFLKMLRDRIQLGLTRNPVKRAELLLHYGDKRIAASLALAEKGKSGSAVSTATKAEKYLERALGGAEQAAGSGEEMTAFYEKLRDAAGKHEKVLQGIKSRIPEESMQALEDAMALRQQIYEKVVGEVGEGGAEDIESGEEEGVTGEGGSEEETEMEVEEESVEAEEVE